MLVDIVVGITTTGDLVAVEPSVPLEHTVVKAERSTIDCTTVATQTVVGPQTVAVVRIVATTVMD